MLKSKTSAVCLLILCLGGCLEATDNGAKERTGAVGVTSQDIDDMGKPAAPPKNPNNAGGK